MLILVVKGEVHDHLNDILQRSTTRFLCDNEWHEWEVREKKINWLIDWLKFIC